MTGLALMLVALIVLAGACATCVAARHRRTPRELRGDWWSDFEREFRAYARAAAKRDRERRRHRGEMA